MSVSSDGSSENSPDIARRKTYRLMAGMAVAIILLLGLAIFSLSRMQSAPWTSSLEKLKITDTFQKDLPQFEYIEGNKSLSPQNLEGKWTLLSFWSYSCPPCLDELPGMNTLALNWQGPDLDIVTINVDDEKNENFELAKKFLVDAEISLPTIFDKRQILAKAFAVTAYPTHFLVNPQGKMIWQAIGAFKWDHVDSRDQLIKLIERQTPEKVQDPAE